MPMPYSHYSGHVMRLLQDLLNEAITCRPHEINEFFAQDRHHDNALVWMVSPVSLGLRPVACSREDIVSLDNGANRDGFALFAAHWTSRKQNEAIIAVCRPDSMLSATVKLTTVRARPKGDD